MLRQAIICLLFLPQLVISQTSEQHFQVLVAKDASIYGETVEPLQYVDDVTSIEVKSGGFLALVHSAGTTYELKEKVFTFYLKPEKFKDRERPDLSFLYQDSVMVDNTDMIVVLHPKFDEKGVLKWVDNSPLEIFWHLPENPFLSYKVTVMDHNGNKIQDFASKNQSIKLKPFHYGLTKNEFMFQVSSSFAGEAVVSKKYHVELVNSTKFPEKASDLVIKALDLELAPLMALETWKQVISMENGEFYFDLFEKFIQRNKAKLTESGEDVELLLSQNK